MIVTDGDFRAVRYFNADGGHDVSQSMEQEGGVMYRTYSVRQSEDKNFLVAFDMYGRVIKDLKVEMRGELEACFMHRGELWFTSYRKKVIDNQLRFMAFIGRFNMKPVSLAEPAGDPDEDAGDNLDAGQPDSKADDPAGGRGDGPSDSCES